MVGRNMSLKNPVTSQGIDPGTVRLVVQRLNHYTTPGPHWTDYTSFNPTTAQSTTNNHSSFLISDFHHVLSIVDSSAFEDGTYRGFRNGIYIPDAGELP
jgi:hypothetical protein